MNDFDVIAYVRDVMLENPTLDADFVWNVAKLAEEDDFMYRLMSEYMRTERNDEVIDQMTDYMTERGLM